MQLSLQSFLAGLLATAGVRAHPLNAEAPTTAVSLRFAEPLHLEADASAGRHVARDDPSPGSVPNIDNDEGATRLTSPFRRGLDKRSFLLDLRQDTGTKYRVLYNGVIIICEVFFDLASSQASVTWYPESSNPSMSSIVVGVKKLVLGVTRNYWEQVLAPFEIPHDQKVPIPNVSPGMTINIFKP